MEIVSAARDSISSIPSVLTYWILLQRRLSPFPIEHFLELIVSKSTYSHVSHHMSERYQCAVSFFSQCRGYREYKLSVTLSNLCYRWFNLRYFTCLQIRCFRQLESDHRNILENTTQVSYIKELLFAVQTIVKNGTN